MYIVPLKKKKNGMVYRVFGVCLSFFIFTLCLFYCSMLNIKKKIGNQKCRFSPHKALTDGLERGVDYLWIIVMFLSAV